MLCVFYAEPRISRVAISSGRERAISRNLVHSLKAKSVLHNVKSCRRSILVKGTVITLYFPIVLSLSVSMCEHTKQKIGQQLGKYWGTG